MVRQEVMEARRVVGLAGRAAGRVEVRPGAVQADHPRAAAARRLQGHRHRRGHAIRILAFGLTESKTRLTDGKVPGISVRV